VVICPRLVGAVKLAGKPEAHRPAGHYYNRKGNDMTTAIILVVIAIYGALTLIGVAQEI
jgi:hypothetical protein